MCILNNAHKNKIVKLQYILNISFKSSKIIPVLRTTQFKYSDTHHDNCSVELQLEGIAGGYHFFLRYQKLSDEAVRTLNLINIYI